MQEISCLDFINTLDKLLCRYHLHLPENQEEAKSDLQVTQIHWNAKERRIRASERKTWMCQKIRADKGEFFKG